MSPSTRLRGLSLLVAVWCGVMLGIVAGTASGFALLPRPSAGDLAARLLHGEAIGSVILATGLLLAIRTGVAGQMGPGARARQFFIWSMVALFAVVLGYFALQPELAQLRPLLDQPQVRTRFGLLHAASAVLFAVRWIAFALLAWWLGGLAQPVVTETDDTQGLPSLPHRDSPTA